MTNKNLTFVDVVPPEIIDTFLDQTISIVVKILWKGEPFLRVCSVENDIKPQSPLCDPDEERKFDNDEEDEEMGDVPPPTRGITNYLINCEWDLYKYHHGDFRSKQEALDASHAVADEMEKFLREKFFRKAAP